MNFTHLSTMLISPATAVLLLAATLAPAQGPTPVTLTVPATGTPISPDLLGIFFEDLNYAADGGLYAELVQNRSFEYEATAQVTWNPLTCWQLTTRGGGKGSLVVDAADPLHANNPHYAVVHVTEHGAGVGLVNTGFDGITVQAGESYAVSLFARQIYTGQRWGSSNRDAPPPPIIVRLESESGDTLGEATLGAPGWEWTRLAGKLKASATDPAARLAVLTTGKGGLALDVVSLFPEKTFRNRTNGLRPDLAQAIAELQPKFMRFPGGCLVHGNGLPNMYRWKDTIGPIEQRRAQANLWGYHQTAGLGYYEYFQFCEDIEAKPLPVVPAGVCCQNAGQSGGTGQRGLPMDQMPAYVQEVLDLIEWANGPASSPWGAKRAAAGHPEPFKLQYLGVGNEEHITPVFRERFQMLHAAIKARHPEITVIGTVGPFHSGKDFEEGWKIADELAVAMVDEHYYERPEWFLNNLRRYDSYDRAKSKVYVGEYAAHERDRANTWRSALAEAAYLTSLERNGDVVRLASYAPLLAKQSHTQWRPDMIYFSNTNLLLTANYQVQKVFSQNSGDVTLPVALGTATNLAVSCVRHTASGDIVLKLVNPGPHATPVLVQFAQAPAKGAQIIRTVIAAEPQAVNTFEKRAAIFPSTTTIPAAEAVPYTPPPYSVTVLRLKSR